LRKRRQKPHTTWRLDEADLKIDNAVHGRGRPIMKAKVALFRAREEAAGSAARLRRLGLSVATLPAIETAPLQFAPARARYDAVIGTSAKSFLNDAFGDKTIPLYVVGARTAHAAEALGWRLAAPFAPDAARLIGTLKACLEPGASVLYFAGRERKNALESALSEFCAVEVVETYVAEAREAWRPSEARALASCAAALHYSRRSAEVAALLARKAGLAAHFLSMRHICLSGDVAEPLEALGAVRVFVADAPDEPALFATLNRALRGFPYRKASRI
jgi:uroporphyrinogen-III synthase